MGPMSFARGDGLAIDTAPGSPPDLTNSKSSKSSSFQSSSLSDLAGPNDISHFEEIALDDPQASPSAEAYNGTVALERKDLGLRPAVRSSVSSLASNRSSTHAAAAIRDLTHGPKHRLSAARGSAANAAEQSSPSLGVPSARMLRRGFASPSTPSLSGRSSSGRRSRSPSPSLPQRSSFSVSQEALSRTSSTTTLGLGFQPPVPAGPDGRRRSWQPGRKKSAKELEDEIDDKDEDLPEDAVICNVPFSPRPFEGSPSLSGSPATSPSPSPSVSPSASPIVSPSSTQSALASPPPPDDESKSPPSPLTSGSPQATLEDVPKRRSKSWTDAFSELDPEVRLLNSRLDEFFETQGRQREEQVQSGKIKAGSLEKEREKVSASSIELPPLNKGNIMIDPLPVSKEKEKCLTRTRPSWLPPKDKQQEKKHLRAYQQMMAQAKEAERRQAAKAKLERDEKERWNELLLRLWDERIPVLPDRIPNPSGKSAKERAQSPRELSWRGLPSQRRAVIWQKMIGNELNLSESSFNAALQRAKTLDASLAKLSSEERNKARESAWFAAIRRDAKATFPEVKLFQPDGPLHDALVDVLMAYSMYRSDVGYVYGTHLIAGLLVLNLPSPSSAFITLANLFNRPLPMAFLIDDKAAMATAYASTLHLLSYKLPRLHEYLTKKFALHPSEYLDPMFRTMFCHATDIDHASRIWDVYVFDGDAFLFRAAVGVLMRLEASLYASRDDVVQALGWGAGEGGQAKWKLGSEEEFVRDVREAGKE